MTFIHFILFSPVTDIKQKDIETMLTIYMFVLWESYMTGYSGLKWPIDQYNVLRGYFSHGTLDDMGEIDKPKYNNSWTRAYCLKTLLVLYHYYKTNKACMNMKCSCIISLDIACDVWLYAQILVDCLWELPSILLTLGSTKKLLIFSDL